MVNDVEDGTGNGIQGKETQAHDHVTDLTHDVEGEDSPELVLHDRSKDTEHHGEARHHEDQRVGEGNVLHEKQREDADQRVDADLREKARKDGGHRCGRGVIGGRKPEEQGKDGRLDPKGDQEEHGQGVHHCRVTGLTQGDGKVGHVQRAGFPVKDPHRRQEEGRRDEIEGYVFQRSFHLRPFASQGHEDERCDQHDLEPDVEVEDVARQKGPGHPHQQDVEKRVVAV